MVFLLPRRREGIDLTQEAAEPAEKGRNLGETPKLAAAGPAACLWVLSREVAACRALPRPGESPMIRLPGTLDRKAHVENFRTVFRLRTKREIQISRAPCT